MPADSVSKQLASLTRESDEDAEDSDTVPLEQPADDEEIPEPVPVPLEKLTGVWTTEAEGGEKRYWFTTARALTPEAAIESPIWHMASSAELVSLRR